MLKKHLRLVKQKDFENVFDKGRYFSEDFLSLKVVKNNLDNFRFGFIVSNKISKKAITRNRIKRLLRESIRLLHKDIKPGFDGVFVSKNKAVDKSFGEINLCVEKLLKKSGLFVK